MKGTTTLRKFRWLFAWQDNKMENWLIRMSLEGWHLDSISMIGLVYNFIQGDPSEYIYRLDYRSGKEEEIAEYIKFIESIGWEHVVYFTGWQYFRRLKDDVDTSEFFTDSESKIEKYKRISGTLNLLYPFSFVIFLAKLEVYPLWFAIILVSVITSLIIFNTVNIVSLKKRIKELEG